jgi:hypothetical protein
MVTPVTDYPNEPLQGYDIWDSYPQFPVTDWQYEVGNNDTRRGYWSWVRAKLEEVQ